MAGGRGGNRKGANKSGTALEIDQTSRPHRSIPPPFSPLPPSLRGVNMTANPTWRYHPDFGHQVEQRSTRKTWQHLKAHPKDTFQVDKLTKRTNGILIFDI